MAWDYVTKDEANAIMRKYNPFNNRFPGSEIWDDIKRLANNAIMCDYEHKTNQATKAS